MNTEPLTPDTMLDYISPFAEEFPRMPEVPGVRLSSAHTGMCYEKRNDIMLATFAEGTTTAGVFTKSNTPGAPVIWNKKTLEHGVARALIVNAGISNVFTGKKGYALVEDTASEVAKLMDCNAEEVYVASTGVIGVLPDKEKLLGSLGTLRHRLDIDQWIQAARAILTTDTFTKGVTRKAFIGPTEVTINGFIKGSGMVEPNMATMLGYVFTDAKIPAPILQAMLNEDVATTYNAITVDSDTSTSDTVQIFATGQAEHWDVTQHDAPELADFREKLLDVHKTLAQLVVKDGEGISKFVTIQVNNASTKESAKIIAKSIANSPLVKTAIAGSDPNWGRIIMAIGKSGEPLFLENLKLWIGPHLIAEHEAVSDQYNEGHVAGYMKQKEIKITVDAGLDNPDGNATVWTSDLTHEYININVDYRS